MIRLKLLFQGMPVISAILQTESRQMKARRQRASRKSRRPRTGYWSAEVMRRSNALDLESKVFTSTNPRRIAFSLKRSAQASRRRKGSPYQSAMSMLNFYINRAGKGLSASRKRILERAKPELRKAFGRE
jgi:hypothetical protein